MDKTIPTSGTITVIVRAPLSGEEFDLELPASSTGREIKGELLSPENGLNLPTVDNEGNSYEYKLINKTSGKEITDSKTLAECLVKDGDVLVLSPILVAGLH